MAIIYRDSFDHYTNLAQKWDIVMSTYAAGDGYPTIVSSAGRNSTPGMRFGGTINTSIRNFAMKNFAATATIIVGFGVKLTGLSSAADCRTLVTFTDAGEEQCSIGILNDGSLEARRFDTILGLSSGANVSSSVFKWLEIKVTINNSTGVVQAYLDGTQIFNLSSQDTQYGSAAQTTGIAFGTNFNPSGVITPVTPCHYDMDDLIIKNLTDDGIPSNYGFSGDRRVYCLFPTSDGSYNAWTAVGGGTRTSKVSENPPDGDTSYISSSGTTDKQTFNFETMVAGTIDDVCVTMMAKKDSGAVTLRGMTLTGGASPTEGASGSDIAVTTDYFCAQGGLPLNPETAVAWTSTAMNASEFGIKRTA